MNLDEAIALGKSRSDCHPNNIDTLVRIVNELRNVSGDIAEVGSYRCGSTIALAAAAQTGRRVYALDLFGGLPYGDGVGFDNFADADFEEIKAVTARLSKICLVRGRHEEVIPKFFSGRTFPFCLIFMDSDHYSSHKVALEHLWPLLSPGGMVVFHDWSFPGVQAAIKEVLGSVQNVNDRYPESPNMGFIVKP